MTNDNENTNNGYEVHVASEKHKRKILIIVSAAVIAALIAIIIILLKSNGSSTNPDKPGADLSAEELQDRIEQLELENQMLQSANEFQSLDNQFAAMENQTQLLANDSIIQKYAASKAQVEKLLTELKNEKTKNAAQIKKLQDEIDTLKGILRDYTERINELMEENEGLRTENENVKSQNEKLNNQVQQVTRSNEQLTERMTLAEKLNVTGVTLKALNKKGKNEKKISKATRLAVTFTISPNNSTPPGEKTIYMRIISPEGDLLGNGGNFSFEGSSLKSTARTTVEYANEEIGGVTIYWDVNATLNPGTYTVELFSDNYRLASRQFTMSN